MKQKKKKQMKEVEARIRKAALGVILALGRFPESGTLDMARWDEISPHLEELDRDLEAMGCGEHERDVYFDSYLAMIRNMRAGRYDKAGAIVGIDGSGSIDECADPGKTASLAWDIAAADSFEQVCKSIRDKYEGISPEDSMIAMCKSMSLRQTISELS